MTVRDVTTPGEPILVVPDTGHAMSLEMLEETAAFGTYLWLPGHELWWSRGMFRLIGLEPGTATTAEFAARIHPDDRHLVAGAVAASSGGVLAPIQYRLIRPDGQRWILGRGQITRDAAGTVVRVVGTAIDVTELHTTAQALVEASSLLAETELAAGFGTHIYDLTTARFERSAGLRRLLGLSPDEVIDDDSRIELTHPEDRERQVAWGARLRAGETVPPLHVRAIRRDGKTLYLETFGRRVERATGACLVGITIDATARFELELGLRHAAKMEAIGSLAAGIAHDFNNYLTVLHMQVDTLRHEPRRPEPAELDDMKDVLDRSTGLVRQLLSFARRDPFQLRPTSLPEIAGAVINLFAKASAPGVAVDLVVLGPVIVDADPTQLDGALMNLLVNARDAMPAGGRISVEIDVVERDGERWGRLVVGDSGVGIPPADLERIFEPYYTTKPEGRGTGLGLASVYGTMRQHGGSIRVDSEPGRGTRFELLFRLARTATVVTPDAAAARGALAHRRVLVVDDVWPVRLAIAGLLASEGMIVDEAADGAEALDRARAGAQWDLVLTDVAMPGLDGRGLSDALHQLAPDLPVVLMSGRFVDDADIVLAKPFSRDDLVRVLERALARPVEPAPS